MQAITLKFGEKDTLSYLVCNGLQNGNIQVVLLNSDRSQRRAPEGYSDKRGGVITSLWHDMCQKQKTNGSPLKKLSHKEIPNKIRETALKIFQEMSKAPIVHIRTKRCRKRSRFIKTRFSKKIS